MVSLTIILCFSLITAVSCHGPENDHTEDCRKAESLFYSLCSPDPITPRTVQGAQGKRGAPGPKGDVGVGVQGPPGVVDYGSVDSTIDRKLEQAISDQNAKIAELTASLETARQKIKAIEGRESLCHVKYDGKCFWLRTTTSGINWEQGKAICVEQGGLPADIYSEKHYHMIKEYVRGQIPPSTGDIIYIWLGMRFNVQTMRLTLSDGTSAPFAKWHRSYPLSKAGWTYIGLHVRASWGAAGQDMYNHAPTNGRIGVLCQKD